MQAPNVMAHRFSKRLSSTEDTRGSRVRSQSCLGIRSPTVLIPPLHGCWRGLSKQGLPRHLLAREITAVEIHRTPTTILLGHPAACGRPDPRPPVCTIQRLITGSKGMIQVLPPSANAHTICHSFPGGSPQRDWEPLYGTALRSISRCHSEAFCFRRKINFALQLLTQSMNHSQDRQVEVASET